MSTVNAVIGMIDDEQEALKILDEWTEGQGTKFSFEGTTKLAEFRRFFRRRLVNKLIADLRIGQNINGVSLLEEARKFDPNLELIVLTSFQPTSSERKRCEDIGAKIYHKMQIDSLFEDLAGPSKSSSAAAETMKADVLRTLVNNFLVADLIEDLEQVEDKSGKIANSEKSVEDILNDIKNQTPDGLEYIRLWAATKKTLHRLGKH